MDATVVGPLSWCLRALQLAAGLECSHSPKCQHGPELVPASAHVPEAARGLLVRKGRTVEAAVVRPLSWCLRALARHSVVRSKAGG